MSQHHSLEREMGAEEGDTCLTVSNMYYPCINITYKWPTLFAYSLCNLILTVWQIKCI
jgi:hypothetical protein